MLHRYSTYMYLTVLSTLPYKIHVGTEYLHVLECSYLHASYIIVKFLKFSSFFEKKICFWPVTFMSLELTCTQFLTRKNLLSQYPLCCVAQNNSLHKKCLKVSYSVVFLGLVQFMYVWQNVPSIIQDAVVIFFATTVESSKINTMYKNTSLTGVVLFPVFTGIWWCSSMLCIPCWPLYPPWCWSCPFGWTWT